MDSGVAEGRQQLEEVDPERQYEMWLADAQALRVAIGVPDEIAIPTLDLLEWLRQYDVRIARDSLKGLRIALTVADTIQEFYGYGVDKAAVWSAFILHDIGKGLLPHEVNDKSYEGIDWPAWAQELMDAHPVLGYFIAIEHGLPLVIARPIAESHGKQLGRVYGLNPVLSPQELHVRNCLAIADASEAMFSRDNSFNRGMSLEAKFNYVREYAENACRDYQDSGQELAGLIAQRLRPLLEALVAPAT